jgi:hypothetical protein
VIEYRYAQGQIDRLPALATPFDGRERPHVVGSGKVLVDRADTFLVSHPNAEDQPRRIFTPKLATVCALAFRDQPR